MVLPPRAVLAAVVLLAGPCCATSKLSNRSLTDLTRVDDGVTLVQRLPTTAITTTSTHLDHKGILIASWIAVVFELWTSTTWKTAACDAMPAKEGFDKTQKTKQNCKDRPDELEQFFIVLAGASLIMTVWETSLIASDPSKMKFETLWSLVVRCVGVFWEMLYLKGYVFDKPQPQNVDYGTTFMNPADHSWLFISACVGVVPLLFNIVETFAAVNPKSKRRSNLYQKNEVLNLMTHYRGSLPAFAAGAKHILNRLKVRMAEGGNADEISAALQEQDTMFVSATVQKIASKGVIHTPKAFADKTSHIHPAMLEVSASGALDTEEQLFRESTAFADELDKEIRTEILDRHGELLPEANKFMLSMQSRVDSHHDTFVQLESAVGKASGFKSMDHKIEATADAVAEFLGNTIMSRRRPV